MTPTERSASRESLGEQAHHHAFSGAGVAVDEREAAFTQVRLFDPPAEVLDLRRHVEGLDRHLRGERVPFEAIEGQKFLVHTVSSFSVGK